MTEQIPSPGGSELVVLSAPDEAALVAEISRFATFIDRIPDARLVDIAYTASLTKGRAVLAIVASSAQDLRDLTLKIYTKAADHAAAHGIIIADTKLEFGTVDGRIILADEVLTPDSSRFWPADTYEVGKEQPSFDKQYVRNWLNANWDRTGNPPHMPEEVIAQTTQKYITAYEMITGKKW